MASSSPEEAVKAAGIGLGLVGHWGPGWEEGARSPSPGLREGEGRRGRSRPPLSLSPPQSASHPRVGGTLKEPSLDWSGTLLEEPGDPPAQLGGDGSGPGGLPAAGLPQAQSLALRRWDGPGEQGGQDSAEQQSAPPQGTRPSLGPKARVSHQKQGPGPTQAEGGWAPAAAQAPGGPQTVSLRPTRRSLLLGP